MLTMRVCVLVIFVEECLNMQFFQPHVTILNPHINTSASLSNTLNVSFPEGGKPSSVTELYILLNAFVLSSIIKIPKAEFKREPPGLSPQNRNRIQKLHCDICLSKIIRS
jgi:hypothetical protein